MHFKKTTLKTISPIKTWNKILCAIFLKLITCASILTKYNLVWHICILMLIITFIINCTHQHSDWPRVPSLFWEFTWFCGQEWLEYNLLSNYICRLYRAQCACVIHFLLKSASTWMVLSDAAAWCICPCIFRSTNKIYLHYTQ